MCAKFYLSLSRDVELYKNETNRQMFSFVYSKTFVGQLSLMLLESDSSLELANLQRLAAMLI